MHKWAKVIMEYVKSETEKVGIHNIKGSQLEELEKWVCIADKIVDFDYKYHITEEMEKESQRGGRYFSEPREEAMRMYRGGSRRMGYDEDMRMYRDMDIENGSMYYPQAVMGGNRELPGIDNSNRGYSESRYERAKRGYEEYKQMNPQSENMSDIQKMFDALDDEIKDLKPKMTANEKSYTKNKLTSIANNIM